MMLVCPETREPDVERLLDALDGGMAEISGQQPLRGRARDGSQVLQGLP
jgi:hypothetical protein